MVVWLACRSHNIHQVCYLCCVCRWYSCNYLCRWDFTLVIIFPCQPLIYGHHHQSLILLCLILSSPLHLSRFANREEDWFGAWDWTWTLWVCPWSSSNWALLFPFLDWFCTVVVLTTWPPRYLKTPPSSPIDLCFLFWVWVISTRQIFFETRNEKPEINWIISSTIQVRLYVFFIIFYPTSLYFNFDK